MMPIQEIYCDVGALLSSPAATGALVATKLQLQPVLKAEHELCIQCDYAAHLLKHSTLEDSSNAILACSR